MTPKGMLGNDVRFGWRMLRRYPGFSVTAVLVLALGIGANAAIFSAVSAVIMAPLPFPESSRLVRIVGTTEFNGEVYQSGVFPHYYDELKRRASTLEAIAAQRYRNLTLTGSGEPERIVGIGITEGWPATVGVEPALGRHFTSTELAQGEDAGVMLITHQLWQRRFGGAPDALGRSLELNGREYTVIGVMPPQFNFPYNTDLWLPLVVQPEMGAPGDLNVPARIKPGVTPEQAIAELESIGAGISRESPGDDRRGLTARGFDEEFPRDPDNAIAMLFAAVGFVLLIACVNVANLQLARAAGRSREAAIRSTLGASRLRQVRQLLVESLMLAGVAGVLGVMLAYAANEWLAVLVPARLGEVMQSVELAPGVLAFAAGISVLTAVVFGLAPAMKLSSVSPAEALRAGGRFGTGASRLLRPLVVAQVALAFVLLLGAGLMAKNFAHLMGVDVGYETAGLYRVGLGLPEPTYDDPGRRAGAVTRIVEQVGALPGVERVAVTNIHPVPRTNENSGARLVFPGMRPDEDFPVVNGRMVTPGYFETVGIPVLRGRGISQADTADSRAVAVISRDLAERFWPGENPVGERFQPGGGDRPWHTVVGVVGEIAEPNHAPEGTLYRPYVQATRHQQPGIWDTTSVELMIRSSVTADSFLESVSRAVWSVDPNLTLFDASPMAALLAEPLEGKRLGTLLFLGFGAFGLFMAALGTYGVIALMVAARSREYGIRLALGIEPRRLWRFIVGQGMVLVLAGLAVGLAGALFLAPLASSVIREVAPRDPVVMAASAFVLLVAGLAACWLPASRARRVDPASVLREE